MSFVYVFFGGGLGSVVRYLIGILFQKSSLSLPVATLASNVLACLLFSFSLHLIESKHVSPSVFKLLILTGFCGGLSTFSTFGFETFLLFKQGSMGWALLNIVISITLCLSSFIFIKKIDGF